MKAKTVGIIIGVSAVGIISYLIYRKIKKLTIWDIFGL
ncbi:TPA_asm: hypothetical protein ES702_05914 [Lokiarchaeia virus SkuldV3]|uniref:Uncharacterized protein n=1 Tax=Lokiarchaeia virus SkuldV3 TaxID=2983915 RepID=A0A9N6YJA0_9VIRU|nr:hypothetical protein QKT74_gp11 [Lokiarchaeia virus SkuldV3]DAZ90951.1 TPA_asm: hypothetical protein ES702_05914 [Lokiarchaeia virus SkuldV3]